MNTQPEALRLADEFDWWVARGLNLEPRLADAAAELRRLHEVNQELLEALSKIANTLDEGWRAGSMERMLGDIARAAIAKAESEKKNPGVL